MTATPPWSPVPIPPGRSAAGSPGPGSSPGPSGAAPAGLPHHDDARRRPRRAPAVLLGLVLVALGLGGAWLVTRGPAALAGAVDLAGGPAGSPRGDARQDVPAPGPDLGTPDAGTDLATAGDLPGAEGLDPELVARLVVARDRAAADGIELRIVSGARTAEEQQALVDRAVRRYGSREEAQRWVLPPEASAHVQGLAVDIGPTDAALWVDAHQEELGLCRTYANEVWHLEVTGAVGDPCPEPWPDASHGWG